MPARIIRFGLFELDTGTRQLNKEGRRVRLQDQPLRILEILLEKPGTLVTREDLKQRLWPSDIYVDFELGLNGAVKRLRLALGDSADNPRFVETVPKAGYRFIAPVQSIDAPGVSAEQEAAVPAAAVVTPAASEPSSAPRRSRSLHSGIVASVAVAVLLIAYLLRPSSPTLQITRITQLSTSGHAWAKESLMSDGARLYYTDLTIGKGFQLRQILLNGNEDTPLPGLPPNALIRGLSPDHTMFLYRSATEDTDLASYGVVPVVGGPPRRLGDFQANDVTWSPDGNSLIFGQNSQLLIAGPDGTGARVLATAPGWVFLPRWSPDGRRIRFSVLDVRNQLTIWEVETNGSHFHQLQINLPGNPMEGFGEWTPDGHYYVFVSLREGISNLWAVEEESDWLHRRRPEPVQLTAGPMSYSRPLPSRDGKRIFALGTQPTGELLRFDAARNDFVPFLGGRSADQLDFTRDGRWVTYAAYPDGTLWRGRTDGSEQLQLTFPPQRVFMPRWSPDGKRILFAVRESGDVPKIYTISTDGGNPQPVVSESHAQASASWSPAGDAILYGRDPFGENQDMAIYQFDISSGHTQKIPGTDGLYGPLWSPDGLALVCNSVARERPLVLIDLKTGKRTTLSQHAANYPTWSPDSQYIYFNTLMPGEQRAVFRVRVADGKEERITTIRFPATGGYGFWSGLAPDGSPLVLRNHEQTNVYSLSLGFH